MFNSCSAAYVGVAAASAHVAPAWAGASPIFLRATAALQLQFGAAYYEKPQWSGHRLYRRDEACDTDHLLLKASSDLPAADELACLPFGGLRTIVKAVYHHVHKPFALCRDHSSLCQPFAASALHWHPAQQGARLSGWRHRNGSPMPTVANKMRCYSGSAAAASSLPGILPAAVAAAEHTAAYLPATPADGLIAFQVVETGVGGILRHGVAVLDMIHTASGLPW